MVALHSVVYQKVVLLCAEKNQKENLPENLCVNQKKSKKQKKSKLLKVTKINKYNYQQTVYKFLYRNNIHYANANIIFTITKARNSRFIIRTIHKIFPLIRIPTINR